MGNMCGTVKIFPFLQYPYLFFKETWAKWRSFLQRMTESLIQHNSFSMEIVEIWQCTFCDWSGKVGPILDERISDSPESTLRWGIFGNVKTLPREITRALKILGEELFLTLPKLVHSVTHHRFWNCLLSYPNTFLITIISDGDYFTCTGTGRVILCLGGSTFGLAPWGLACPRAAAL